MHWLILIISGLFEAVWATALDRSEGFSRVIPTALFGLGLLASMAGLGYALKEIPVGTGYAVWVAIGAVATILYAMATGAESFSLFKVLFLTMIVGGVVGLKLTH